MQFRSLEARYLADGALMHLQLVEEATTYILQCQFNGAAIYEKRKNRRSSEVAVCSVHSQHDLRQTNIQRTVEPQERRGVTLLGRGQGAVNRSATGHDSRIGIDAPMTTQRQQGAEQEGQDKDEKGVSDAGVTNGITDVS
ncbi:hypothetical protein PoB_003055100 [Plakobranchus ocellatus]|uniref:Uncharacterized protein n=1 Tax=Plakobranchus ocellatus TaxID=259542 RepID=A0AAV3ZYM0_9GAST|nr:hypothetical protein PoB_003055100 [Plakobranchus ocellatus]